MSANPVVRVQRSLQRLPKTAFCTQQAFLGSLSLERQRCERAGSLLLLAQRTIPMGTAYAVWTGIGAVGA